MTRITIILLTLLNGSINTGRLPVELNREPIHPTIHPPMNKAELIDLVAERAGLSKKDATSAVESALDGIKNAVAKGDKVSLSGFGIFEKSDRAARTGRNPATGQPIPIAAKTVVKARIQKQLKDAVLPKKAAS